MKKQRLKPLAVAVMLATLAPVMTNTSVMAAGLQEKVEVVPGKTISPREEAIISSAGTKVLRHIAQARADIHDKNTKQARTELGQAEKLLDIIEASLPTTVVKDRIWVAKKHLEYETSEKVLPDLIPISSSLDELVDFMPVNKARDHLAQAKKHLQAGDKQKAQEALDATDAAIEYTEVDLPLSTTRQLVMQAKKLLQDNKGDEANKALESAENSVVYMAFEVEDPLYAAKTSIWQAVLDVDRGEMDLAKADLQNAISQLKVAATSKDKATQRVANKLLDQAKQFQQDLDTDSQIASKLQRLWAHTKAFTDRNIEYLVAGWERYRADTPFKSDLIEAKMHLANARIDLFTGHETEAAKQELASSIEYLDKAEVKSKLDKQFKSFNRDITHVQTELKKLSKNPESAQLAQYTTLEKQVNGMIRKL